MFPSIRCAALRRAMALGACAASLLAPGRSASAQQLPDTAFAPPITSPAFASGTGPVVLIDEGHANFHTLEGRFRPFASLAARDGFRVRAHGGRFTRAGLDSARILVIANALDPRNTESWKRPIYPAFDSEEVATLEHWVRDGGALLLVADHMPFGGAAASLAAAFDVQMSDGFAYDARGESRFVLRRGDGALRAHALTDGRSDAERIDSVEVFTGQAFHCDRPVDTLLVLAPGAYVLLPEEAWKFTRTTERRDAGGALVGAALQHGRGRVVVFGEAAMLTAQLAGPGRQRMGMNAPSAPQNSRLVLGTLRWLAEPSPERFDAPVSTPRR